MGKDFYVNIIFYESGITLNEIISNFLLAFLDKEFSILQKAALAAYREKYPNREHFLTK